MALDWNQINTTPPKPVGRPKTIKVLIVPREHIQFVKSLKKALLSIKRRTRAKQANDLVMYFRAQLIIMGEGKGIEPFFYTGFNDREFKAAISLISKGVQIEECKTAIIWFLNHDYWWDKTNSLWGVAKQFHQFRMQNGKKKKSPKRSWLLT